MPTLTKQIHFLLFCKKDLCVSYDFAYIKTIIPNQVLVFFNGFEAAKQEFKIKTSWVPLSINRRFFLEALP